MKRLCLLAFALALAGCASKDPNTPPPATAQSEAPKSPPAAAAAKPAAPKVDLDRSKVPAALQSAGYAYSGLSNDRPMTLSGVQKPEGGSFSGTIENRLTSVHDGVARFAADTTGDLRTRVGDGVFEARKDGIYSIGSPTLSLDKPMLSLPAGVGAGARWLEAATIKTNGTTVLQRLEFVSKGVEAIKLGGKPYQALHVVGVGSLIVPSTKKRLDVKDEQWYVKDVGLVKERSMQTDKTAEPVSIEMEWQPDASGGKR